MHILSVYPSLPLSNTLSVRYLSAVIDRVDLFLLSIKLELLFFLPCMKAMNSFPFQALVVLYYTHLMMIA